MPFVKIYDTILRSSVWLEDPPTRIVWLTLLALADQGGHVEASVPGLAHTANIPLSTCQKALRLLLGPDPHSKDSSNQGRRIEKAEGGWLVLNYTKYREMPSPSAVRMRRMRKRAASQSDNVTTEAEAEAEAEAETTDTPPSGALALKDAGLRIFEFWAAKVDKPRAQWNAKKKAMLRARWKELKGTPEEKEHLLKNVVDAAVHDPFYSGAETGTVYWEWENLFRNSERVEKLLGLWEAQKKGKGRKKTVTDKNRETIAAYRRPGE